MGAEIGMLDGADDCEESAVRCAGDADQRRSAVSCGLSWKVVRKVSKLNATSSAVGERRKLSLAKVLAAFRFIGIVRKRNAVLLGGTGTHLANARSCIRPGARGRLCNVLDLVSGWQGRLAHHLPLILDELG
jgi:hypothetical protein